MACSGVVAAPQSNAYAARATVRIARQIGFAKRITKQARRTGASCQGGRPRIPSADLAPVKECVCELGNMTSAVEEVAERRRDIVGLGGLRVCGDLILRGGCWRGVGI